MSAALLPPPLLTVAQFLDWDSGDRSGRCWQLVDGEPQAMAPASETHAAIQSELARLIGNHLLATMPTCRVLSEPGIIPSQRPGDNFRIPDLGVTCAPPSAAMIVADPVLLIEILSPSNKAETRQNAWAYMTIPGVREILIVDSTQIAAEVLSRDGQGEWPRLPERVAADGTLTLASIGLAMRLRAAYRTTTLA